MATITATMIKELRERTGVGMAKCKEALEEAGGDMELAIANLRKAGMATAVKKEGRVANEGKIAILKKGDVVVIVEVNSETDFVANNNLFLQFLSAVAEEIALKKPADLDALLKGSYSKDPSLTIDHYRANIIQAIGENIQIRRFKLFYPTATRSIGVYSHLGGKLVVVLELEGSHKEEEFAKEIAMHIAAAAPEYLSQAEVPVSVIEHEKEIAKGQIQGKPPHVVEKIVEGKVKAFCDTVCLLPQKYIKDDSLTIQELVARRAKESNASLKVSSFTRWAVGG